MKAQRVFVYANTRADATQLIRAHGMAWIDRQSIDGLMWWINPAEKYWFAGLSAPLVLMWHCEPIPDHHREFLTSRHAFIVPVHCEREGCLHA